MKAPERNFLNRVTAELVDQGLIIEAGWVGLKNATMHPESPEIQVVEMRKAFFAGAMHLFSSMMLMLEPDHEPTASDMNRLRLIDAELRRFGAGLADEIAAKTPPSKGPKN